MNKTIKSKLKRIQFLRKLYYIGVSVRKSLKIGKYWEIKETIIEKLKDDYCIVLVTASLGDTLLFFLFKSQIEEQHNVKIFPIIKDSQKVIPKLVGVSEKDYAVTKSVIDIFIYPEIIFFFPSKGDIGNMSLKPEPGTFFFAHFDWTPKRKEHFTTLPGHEWDSDKCKWKFDFIESAKFMFDLNPETKFINTLSYNNIYKPNLKQKTVFLAPESSTIATTTTTIEERLWIELAKVYKRQGYDVVYNTIKKWPNLSKYAKWINTDLEGALGIATQCEKIISIRSGICDLLHRMDERLVVIYPNQDFLETFSLVKMFEVNKVQEIIYRGVEKTYNDIIN